jgi:integrase
MHTQGNGGRASGHVRLKRRKSGPRWYVKYRTPDGRQIQKCLGPAWTERSRPPARYLTRRMATEELQAILVGLRDGTFRSSSPSGVTFREASVEWLRFAECERACKPSTMRDYRLVIRCLDSVFGDDLLEEITGERIEEWLSEWRAEKKLSNRTVQKHLCVLGLIFKRARKRWGLTLDPLLDVEAPRVKNGGGFDHLTPEEVWSLVRAAASEQDAAIFLTAAFTGLRRGEVLALRWRDVDFVRRTVRVRANYISGLGEGTPKSGKGRAVPMADEVGEALAKLSQRGEFTDEGDLVFRGKIEFVNPVKLGRRYRHARKRAGLRPIRFHDLRHTFGTTCAAAGVPVRSIQEWMGHASITTTMRYMHFVNRSDDAVKISAAFALEAAGDAVPEA